MFGGSGNSPLSTLTSTHSFDRGLEMKNPEPTLSLPVMNEDAYEQKILKFLSENPRDKGCVQTTFADRSGAHSERILFYSWLDPHAGGEIARSKTI